jgi:DNA-binding transcriptional LysR family regulator
VSLSQLCYFVAVAEEQNLTRAAHRLHISQPPLTRQIRALEAELGVDLFERTPQGMRLLLPGKRLLIEAKHIIDKIDQLKHVIQNDRGDLTPQFLT